MIVSLSFIPHSPLLIDAIAKENVQHLKKTHDALSKITSKFEELNVETIIFLSAHSISHEDVFSMNLHDEYTVDLSQFGDHGSHGLFSPDIELMTQIQRKMRDLHAPFTLNSQATLDYGTGVPLSVLTSETFRPMIIPISYSGLSAKEHVQFGGQLAQVANSSTRRVAIVASGDLSHALRSDSPSGFHKHGEVFDMNVQESFKQGSTSGLLSIDSSVCKHASECAYLPLLMLFGAKDKLHTTPEILSYEFPFGVGYLVARFNLEL